MRRPFLTTPNALYRRRLSRYIVYLIIAIFVIPFITKRLFRVINYSNQFIIRKFRTHRGTDILATQACDPFLEPGYLSVDHYHTEGNFWTPLDPKCRRAPHFLQDVLDRKPLPWLQGRTVLLVGDAIERNNLEFFCELVNSTDIKTTPIRNFNAVLRTGNTIKEASDLTRPKICRVEEYNFEIISFFHYGMHDKDIWKDKKVYTPPGLLEQRIPIIWGLMYEHIRQPDIVVLASGLWDLAGWVKEDAYNDVPVSVSIEPDRLERWIERAEVFVDTIEWYFPNALLLWRTLHYCVADLGTWILNEAPDWVDRSFRAPFHELRIHQMNNAYTQLIKQRPQLHRFAWGELMTGHVEEFQDSIYPGKQMGGVLWADMILYYIKRIADKEQEK